MGRPDGIGQRFPILHIPQRKTQRTGMRGRRPMQNLRSAHPLHPQIGDNGRERLEIHPRQRSLPLRDEHTIPFPAYLRKGWFQLLNFRIAKSDEANLFFHRSKVTTPANAPPALPPPFSIGGSLEILEFKRGKRPCGKRSRPEMKEGKTEV